MKILIITQHIFPIQTPRSIRSTELIEEFARRGFDITVYAVLGNYDYSDFLQKYPNIKLKNINIKWQIKAYNSDGSYKAHFLDKVAGRLFGKLAEYPNFEFYYRLTEVFKYETNHDVLISIAVPHQIHWGCAKAKNKYPENFPKKWIADCGDPFMMNGKSKNHYKYFAKYEKQFCKQCSYITVPVKEAIEAYYPEYRKKIKIIPQGFNFDENNRLRHEPNNDYVTFSYAGIFYKDIRNPSDFLDYISNIDIDFRFYVFTQYRELIDLYKSKLGEKIIIKSPVDRKELIEFLKTNDFLLNFENLNSPNQIPSKLIDYAIANRPILNINPKEINKDLISQFMNREYSGELIIDSLSDYHIKNIADKFIELLNE